MKSSIKIIIPIVVALGSFFLIRPIKFKPSELIVEIDAEFVRADRFQLFYSISSVPKFKEQESINNQVKAKQMEKIVFTVPVKDNIVSALRFDFSSSNRTQKPVKINSIVLKTKKSTITLEKEFSSLVKLNKYVSYTNGKFHTQVLNKKYDPYLLFDIDDDILEKLTQEQPRYTKTQVILFSVLLGGGIFLIFSFLPMFITRKD